MQKAACMASTLMLFFFYPSCANFWAVDTAQCNCYFLGYQHAWLVQLCCFLCRVLVQPVQPAQYVACTFGTEGTTALEAKHKNAVFSRTFATLMWRVSIFDI